jgi:hypothetical protein
MVGRAPYGLHLDVLEDRTLPTVAFLPGLLGPGVVNLPTLPLGPLATIAPQAGKPVVEPFVSVNPGNPEQVVASAQNGLRTSTNSGASFSAPPTLFPVANSDGDTSTVFDSQGRLFWTNLDSTTGGTFITQVSPTTGALVPGTRFQATSPPGGFNDDKEVLAVDPATNNLYLVWTRFPNAGPGSTILISRSVNQGMAWSAPVAVSGAGEGFVWPSTIAVAPDGTVYVAYHSVVNFDGQGNPLPNNGQDFVARYSNDLSTLISKTVALTNTQADITFNVQAAVAGRQIAGNVSWTQGSAQPWVLPDPVRPGNVYVVGTNDPTHSALSSTSDIVFARSTNNGAAGSWTVSTIATGPVTTFRAFPTAFIDANGDIFVAWYADTNADGSLTGTNGNGHNLLNVFATYSTNGGQTWATPFQVNDPSLPFDPDVNASFRYAGPPQTLRIGEYFGIDAFGNTAYLDWNGNTFAGGNPTGQQVYYAAFSVPGSLNITGTAGGTVILRREAANPAFLEVVVNGQVQYAGLMAGLNTFTVDGLGGGSTLIVDCSNGSVIPPGGLTYRNFQNVQNIACPLFPTTTSLISSGQPSVGQPVTFTATVTPSSNLVQPLTGNVQFYDGNTLLGTVPLSGTTATFTTTGLSAGTHSIRAVYSGDAFFQTSTATLSQIINPLPPPPPTFIPFVTVAFAPAPGVTDVLTLAGMQLVTLVQTSSGSITQYDSTGAHPLTMTARSASVAFGAPGEVLVVVMADGSLFQFDNLGRHFLAGGVLSAGVAFTADGNQEVLEVVFADGTLVQFDSAGAHQLTTGVRTASVAFSRLGEVLDLVFQDGRLVQFDPSGAHQLATNAIDASVAVSPAGLAVLDVIFADGTLWQFDATGGHKLGSV